MIKNHVNLSTNRVIFGKRLVQQKFKMTGKLWVKYKKNKSVKVSTENCEDVEDFLEACKKKLPGKLGSYDTDQLFLSTTEGGEALEPDLLLTAIPSVSGYMENNAKTPLLINVLEDEEEKEMVSIKSSLPKTTSLITTSKRPFLENETNEAKKRRLEVSKTLVSSLGTDFQFSDRERSFEILAKSLEQRYYCHKLGLKDKGYHALPFLADGPGSGKSRFLQELPRSFANHISDLKHSVYENRGVVQSKVSGYLKETPTAFEDFKNDVSSALFINVSFGNGSMYTQSEVKYSIQVSLCLRILYPYYSDRYSRYSSFYDAYENNELSLPHLSLDSTLTLIGKEYKCIVLGIDEVNYLNAVSREKFRDLVFIVGSLSSIFSPFFVPVLAGTIIGPLKEMVSKSMYPPLHIPLPLLSFESCLNILKMKDKRYEKQVDDNRSLRRVVSYIGGHCRSLEILYIALSKYSSDIQDYWDAVIDHVKVVLRNYYPMSALPAFGMAIAYYYLDMPVGEFVQVDPASSLTFLDLEEYGLLKLDRQTDFIRIKVPFIFIMCYLQSSMNNEYSKFWSQLLISKQIEWRSWEEFNCYYIAFRLSLFSKLGISKTSLSTFLSGAKMNIPEDVSIKIPSMDDIAFKRLDAQYPYTQQTVSPIGQCVVNAPGAPFDGFVYLETATGKILFALQMKLAYNHSIRPQKLTNNSINEEYHKVNDSIGKYIPNTDFILLVLGRCDGEYDVEKLPSKCAVVTRTELRDFYGEAYSQYLSYE